MTGIFHSHIKASLADANLQAALDANAERRIRVRKEAFASLAEPQVLRARAHQIRAEVIEHLEDYLNQFRTQAAQNGMQIHFAADAEQAILIVLGIADQQGAKLIAKSKTMVSEEIRLNQAAEKHGIKVVETDLGEYIVQLRGEPPSHIITPAVHLRRQDVGRLFEEKLGLPYTEDISSMTNAARNILRQVFLDADIGISGVNFGVAETGTLCVVTNEGNGRMVTTIPRTHIALMGIERILPTMDDLALMLSLLPRSATGQKLSVYTSLLNKPRGSDEPDGPSERHVILVDNGRKAVRESELREILYCIRCGACLNACPVFREIGGHAYVSLEGKSSPYPGPMGSVVSPALFGQCEFGHLARASSLCGACREACPVDIDLPRLLVRVRAGMGTNQEAGGPNAPATLAMGLRIFTMAASSSWRFSMAQWVAGLFGSVFSFLNKDRSWLHLPAITGWGYSRDFPRPAGKSFRSKYGKQLSAAVDDSKGAAFLKDAPLSHLSEEHTTPRHEKAPLERFASELEALGGKFSLCSTDEVPDRILQLLSIYQVNDILTWDGIYLPDGLLEKLSSAGIRVSHPTREMLQNISRVRAGLTGVTAAIAETGSLLLPGGAGMPLTASLLPEIHIALLYERDIVEHLSQALQLDDVKRAPAAVLVTGPSRTADIEMTLTIGVHGPGKLHVICIKS